MTWIWITGGMIVTKKNSIRIQNIPNAIFNNINQTQSGLRLNLGRHGEKTTTNCLGHDTALETSF
jgi:hypothetical protein